VLLSEMGIFTATILGISLSGGLLTLLRLRKLFFLPIL